jgi:hypothetical protein
MTEPDGWAGIAWNAQKHTLAHTVPKRRHGIKQYQAGAERQSHEEWLLSSMRCSSSYLRSYLVESQKEHPSEARVSETPARRQKASIAIQQFPAQIRSFKFPTRPWNAASPFLRPET